MNIKPDDLVLEIGSGDNPKARSDVLCDMIPEDNTQRGGAIVLDRPFVAADGQHLPFADKSFDYIICCHVLEHAEDPILFLSELSRVGHRGYIETPTEIGEKLYGWTYHRWYVNLDDSGNFIFSRKTEEGAFGQLFHHLFSTDPDYAKFHDRHHNLFLIQHEWSGEVTGEIVESGDSMIDLKSRESVEKLLTKQTDSGIKSTIKRLMPGWIRRGLKSAIVKGKGRDRRSLQDIKQIIVCPACKGQLRWNEDSISCQDCGRIYPIRDGIPFLLVR